VAPQPDVTARASKLGQAFGVADEKQPQPDTRLSDAERDRAAALMAKYTSEGRLTLDEFSQRVEVVLAARTQAELDQVTSDLPTDSPRYESPIPKSESLVAVFSGSSRRGRWRTGGGLKATAVFGGVDIDLRNAEIDSPTLDIRAIAVFGGIDIVVPEGVMVNLTGFSLFGGKDLRVADAPVLPGSPVINVRAFPVFGGISVRSKRTPRRLIDDLRSVVDARVIDRSGAPVPARPGGVPSPDRHRDNLLDARDALALAGEILDAMFPNSAASRRLGRTAERLDRAVQRGAPAARPRLAPAADGTVTILFSDVSGFTELTERLGDHACQRLLETYFQIVRGQVAAHRGYEVKCHGDEAMLAFGDPVQAVRCAMDIQRSLVRYNQREEGDPLRVHIGMHIGEVIQDRGDFLGRTVILASRITDAALADEILVSSTLHGAIGEAPDLAFGEFRAVELQGVSDPQQLYPVLWS
jgi:class 3 adenylate cyclase